jgi:transcriptional regulator with XRE-family HTH domain
MPRRTPVTPLPRSVGQLVAAQRRLLGLSTYAFAEGCGCSEATIRHIESGRHQPNLLTCYRIADFLKLPRAQVAQLAGHLVERAERALDEADLDRTFAQLKQQLAADPEAWQALVEVLPLLSKDARTSLVRYMQFLHEAERAKARGA